MIDVHIKNKRYSAMHVTTHKNAVGFVVESISSEC
jgi:hypothetical protein